MMSDYFRTTGYIRVVKRNKTLVERVRSGPNRSRYTIRENQLGIITVNNALAKSIVDCIKPVKRHHPRGGIQNRDKS